jgi:hypothetical protein
MAKYKQRRCSFPGCQSIAAMYIGSRCTKHKLTEKEKTEFRKTSFKEHYENRKCLRCGKPFVAFLCRDKDNRGHYCSKECSHPKRIKCVCKWCGGEFYMPPSKIDAGRGRHCSKKCAYASRWLDSIGSANPNWRGIKKHLNRIRKSKQGKSWTQSVKGKKCCEICGSRQDLHAHHIIPLLTLFLEKTSGDINFPYDPNDGFFHNLNNGMLVCLKCHVGLHPKISVLRKSLEAKNEELQCVAG